MDDLMTKKSVSNFLSSILLYIFNLIYGIVVPQLYLKQYGSELNGLTATITQVIGYLLILEAGVGAASIQALYKPLYKKEWSTINRVITTTKVYYNKISMLFGVSLLVASIAFPFLLKGNTNNLVITTLIIIMGGSSLIDFLFVGKYRVLLIADHRVGILSIIQVVSLIMRALITIPLIINGCNILLVQSITILIYILRVPFITFYIRRYYPLINLSVQSNSNLIEKRWSALTHQVFGLIVYNTPTILLAIFSNLKIVSVYAVYNMVYSLLYQMISMAFSQASLASFGNLIAQNNIKKLRDVYTQFELIYYMALTATYSITTITIGSFINLYTRGIDDIEYYNWKIILLFSIVGVLNNLRIPMTTLINAKGAFKETQNSAIIEAVINFSLSIALVHIGGIYGVLIGSIASYLYRTTYLIIYANKNILRQPVRKTVFRAVINVCFGIILVLTWSKSSYSISWVEWLTKTMVTSLFIMSLILVVNLIFERKVIKKLSLRFLHILPINKEMKNKEL